MEYFALNVDVIRLIMSKDKLDLLIKHQHYFIPVLIVHLNGMKID